MAKISLIATLTAADGKEAELEAALRALVEAGAEEDGLEIYSVHGSSDEPGVFRFFELYVDSDAVKVHGQGEQMKAAMGAVGGLLARKPEILRLTPLFAKGLDL